MQEKPESGNPSAQKGQNSAGRGGLLRERPGIDEVSAAARELNATLLNQFPGRTFGGNALLELVKSDALRQPLLPEGMMPESRLIVHPVRHDAALKFAAVADRLPDSIDPGIDDNEAFLATAPLAVLAWAGATLTDDVVPPAQMATASPGIRDSGSIQISPAHPPVTPTRPAAWTGTPPNATEIVVNATEALIEGDWKISWSFGTVTVDMSPESCRLVSGVAGAAAGYSGKKFIDSLFSGKPWYMLVIWGLIMADAGYVSYALSDCAANNHRGRLYWSVFTGIFFATEIPGHSIPKP